MASATLVVLVIRFATVLGRVIVLLMRLKLLLVRRSGVLPLAISCLQPYACPKAWIRGHTIHLLEHNTNLELGYLYWGGRQGTLLTQKS